MTEMASEAPQRPRLPLIDLARGLALVAMATYHFAWDLEFFGYLDPGTASTGFLKLYARAIASSFLVLVGISLVLAHAPDIRWRSFSRRWAMVAAASALITAATYAFTPQTFVFFGILHHIAVASLAGLAVLRLPAPVLAMLAAALFLAAPHLRGLLPDGPAFWWTGLTATNPSSNDFVPFVPWFSAVLAGMALGKLIARAPDRLPRVPASRLSSGLSFLGQHSLAFYLVHQPVLIGLVAGFAWLAPPQQTAQGFGPACARACEAEGATGDCDVYCACAQVELTIAGKMDRVMSEPGFASSDLEAAGILAQCAREAGFGDVATGSPG